MGAMSDVLSGWLSKKLEQRGWSHSELARRASVSQAAVSGTISGDRKAGADFCIKVAQALGESPEKVLRLAEILPPIPDIEDSTLLELLEIARNVSAEGRQEILNFARFRYQQERGEGESGA